jgi:hypothetical protein
VNPPLIHQPLNDISYVVFGCKPTEGEEAAAEDVKSDAKSDITVIPTDLDEMDEKQG